MWLPLAFKIADRPGVAGGVPGLWAGDPQLPFVPVPNAAYLTAVAAAALAALRAARW